MKKKIKYRAEFWTKSGLVPLARSLKKEGIDYEYSEDTKTGVWTLEWEQ